MNKTFFVEYVVKWFSLLASRFVEKINGVKDAPKYLYKVMLKKEYSPDLKWSSTTLSRSVVAADVVALDSPLPLKKRDSLSRADGDIPKIGMKLFKGEKVITDINLMKFRGATEATIAGKLFEDTFKVIGGIYERIEHMFLQALSTGITLAVDADNSGVGIRVDFGYMDKNKFGAEKKWSDGPANIVPLSDITRVLANVSNDGNVIGLVMLDKATFDKIRTSEEGKQLYAASIGFAGANIPVPTTDNFKSLLENEFKLTIQLVDRSVRIEKNGKQTSVKPFATNTLVFLPSAQAGSLFWGTLAEQTNPVNGVDYATVDDFILLSKYSKNDPLREFTSSQALVIPVIEDVESIYILNTEEAQSDEGQTEGDATITIYGDNTIVKADVIAALATLGVVVKDTITDVALIKKINGLSDEKEAALRAALEIV